MLDYLEIPTKEYKQLFGGIDTTTIVPGHPMYDLWVDYASFDAWGHRELTIKFLDMLADVVKWHSNPTETLMYQYWYEEEPQLQTLWRMERRGLVADTTLFDDMARKVEIDMSKVAARINSKLGRPFNPNSTPQKQELLFGPPPLGLGLTPRSYTKSKTTKTPQTDEATLSFFAEQGVEICQDLVDYGELHKLAGYVKGLPTHIASDGRIHTSFSPTKVTGRLSSADPNLQNIPRKDNDKYGIRNTLIAPSAKAMAVYYNEDGDGEEYVLIVADYAQLEMRVLADISGDEAMIQGILDGLDMHSYTAARMNNMPYDEFTALVKAAKAKDKLQGKWRDAEKAAGRVVDDANFPAELVYTVREKWAVGMRAAAKAIGFGIVYGITEHGLSVQLSDALERPVSKAEALKLIDQYLDTFPGVRGYMETTKETAIHTGKVQTYRGRFRHLSKAKSRNKWDVLRAMRQAINARIQGSAHDIVKRAMLYCENDVYLRVDLRAELVLQVHDELIWQCPRRTAAEAVEIIQHYMEHPFAKPLKVPLVAEPAIVTRWGDAK
jgi:DNA polymerase-1